jgi:hypothetical protein
LKAERNETESNHIPRATHGSPDSPLIIGEAKLACYVLEDGTRLITQEALLVALGRAPKAKKKGQTQSESLVDDSLSFLVPSNLKHLISNNITWTTKPVIFRSKSGKLAKGYKAEVLPEVCELYLKARDVGTLFSSQLHIAKAADLMMRGLATVGIIALVDEATGYQKDRSDNGLSKILDAFIAKELQPYVKKFPPEFYEQLFRLHHLPYDKWKRPQYFGKITRDIIYRRLAPGIWDEMKSKVARNEEGRPTQHMHRYLTPDIGDPRLQKLIDKVTTLMQVSRSWDEFIRNLNKILPPYDDVGTMEREKFPKLIHMRSLGLDEQPFF